MLQFLERSGVERPLEDQLRIACLFSTPTSTPWTTPSVFNLFSESIKVMYTEPRLVALVSDPRIGATPPVVSFPHPKSRGINERSCRLVTLE